MARSVVSACSRCSISHREDSVDVAPWASKSVQALAMPCNRNPLSSVVTSLMVDLHRVGHHFISTPKAVVPAGVGQRHLLELQARLHARLRWACLLYTSPSPRD